MSDPVATEDLADLYDNAPCGYLSLTPDQRIAKLNRTLGDWLGRPEAALLGRSVHEILSVGGRIAFETHLAPLLRMQGHVHEIALDLVDAEGAKIPVIANAAERRGEGGVHLFTRLTVFKAVDRRKFERSLIEAKVKAEEATKSEHAALELRDQFIAVLGHDLRNPLASLGAGLRILRRALASDSREEKVIGEMEASLRRAEGLVRDVMDFAQGKLGSGLHVERRLEPALGPTLEHVVREIRSIHPDRAIELSTAIDEPVYCDSARIAQLASNLLSNAVTHGAPDRPVQLHAWTRDDEFELVVCNAGEQIPVAVQEQLFRPFFRGAGHRGSRGLGLGLFIVNEIATAHGGAVTMVSDDDETRFRFAMPRLAGAAGV